MSDKQSTIADDVLSRIKKGEVKMRPGVYFTLISVASLVASVAAGLAMAYLSSVVFFWFKIMNANGNAYGAKNNFSQAVSSFPWWALLIFAASAVFIVFIIRRFGSVYRHRTRSVVLIVIALSLIVGFVLFSLGVGDLGHSTGNQQNSQSHGPWFKK